MHFVNRFQYFSVCIHENINKLNRFCVAPFVPKIGTS